MGAKDRLPGDGKRQFVNSAEIRRPEDRQPVLLMGQKPSSSTREWAGARNASTFPLPPFDAQPLRGLRRQVLESADKAKRRAAPRWGGSRRLEGSIFPNLQPRRSLLTIPRRRGRGRV